MEGGEGRDVAAHCTGVFGILEQGSKQQKDKKKKEQGGLRASAFC